MKKIISFVLIAFLFLGCQRVEEVSYQNEQFVMDTLVKVQVYGKDQQLLQTACLEAAGVFGKIEALTDRYPTEFSEGSISEVQLINQMAGIKPVKVSDDVWQMLLLSKKYNQLTQGAFNVCVGPLVDLWGINQGKDKPPLALEIENALALSLMEDLSLDAEEKSAYLTKKGMSLDLGGIAKGYAIDQAVKILRDRGIEKGIIDAGGNIYVLGSKEDGTAWKIGVQHPRRNGVYMALGLQNQVVSTSGDYQRYFEYEGKRYHHILDPQTGYPAEGRMSVSVVAESSVQADVLSTSFFIMQDELRNEIMQDLSQLGLIIYAEADKVLYSENITEHLVKLKGGKETYEAL